MTGRPPEVKPCEIQWIGTMPSHWSCRRLKHVASVALSSVDKKSHEHEEVVRLCNYVDVYHHERITPELDFMQATATPDEVRRFTLRSGDVLITKDSEAWDDIAVPAYVPSDLDGVLCGYHLAQVRPLDGLIDGDYLSRSFAARGINDQFRVAANGITRFGVGKYWIDNALFLVPPLDEQRAIAAFLDRETTRIDALIEKKRRQIELLQEKRAALISHAVTKGLDPNAPMKDSGIDWLGSVPAQWPVIRIGLLCSVGNGSTPSRENPEYWSDGAYPWLTSAKINEEVIGAADEAVSEVAFRECHLPWVRPESVLLAITGEGQTRGRAALLRCASTISQHLAYISPRSGRLRASFLWRALQSQYEWMRMESSGAGSTRAALTCEFIRTIKIPLPLTDEQEAITAYIEREAHKIDLLAAKVALSIDRLREYRTALISTAVTGKLDVRQEVG